MKRLEGDFDYIVIGAGTAGCIVANRLSGDPAKRVLILEAGGSDNWIWFHIPVGYLFAIGNPRSDWMFRTEPEAGLNGRSLNYPRGKVIGGSSAINAMIYMRGQAADYDHWRQLGLTGWGWDDVLPYFKRHQDHFLGASDAHATGGELARLGIPIMLDRAGVGENLQDHLQLRLIYKVSGVETLNESYRSLTGRARMVLAYALLRRGPLTMAPSQLGLFTRSDASRERANLQFHVQPLSLDKFGDPLHEFPAFTASVCNLQPTSRGFVRLRSADAADKPAIKPNYLSTDEDRRVAVDSIRLARRIVAQPALARYKPVEYLPGGSVGDDEAALIKAAGDIGTTIFHPVGTAKMGRASDPTAVVDERLRVIGLERLRVVDASVMPTITSGNTNAPTMMIAEKGAAMIVEDRRA